MPLKSSALAACFWSLFVTGAAAFSSDDSLLSRSFNQTTTLTNLPIVVTVTFTNAGTNSLRGFFYTDQIPPGIAVKTIGVKVNGSAITDYLFETGSADSVYEGLTPCRWVLETPANFSQANPIPAHGSLQITYSVSAPAAGTFSFLQFSWAGYRASTASAAFGHSESGDQQSLIFTNYSFAPLTVQIAGQGTVSPNYNGQLLQVGKSYRMTATPAFRQRFACWSGGSTSQESALTFVMRSNLTLQANFVTNPFVGLKSAYHGLFAESTVPRNHSRSGSFSLRVSEAGTYSASFQLGAKRLPAAGSFDWLGRSLLQLHPSATNTVFVTLQLDVTNLSAIVQGVVSNGFWTSPLLGYRAPIYAGTNASPWAGRYTLVLPGNPHTSALPGGDGYARMTVSRSGQSALLGKLADGTTVSHAIPVSGDGSMPLYTSLYSARGSLMGWITFADETMSDAAGTLSWIKPALPGPFYLLGFTNETEAVSSQYVAPGSGQRILNFTNGVAMFTDGNLARAITNQIVLTSNNHVINASSNKLTLMLSLPTGLFLGSVVDTNAGRAKLFGGAVLQKVGAGYGFFRGTNQSGEVYFGP